jgi:hypothetical protein
MGWAALGGAKAGADIGLAVLGAIQPGTVTQTR